MNSIGNERKEWYQLHGGIGCNWCTSSIVGAIDLEWNFLIQFTWEWRKETMVSITWRNRMQLMHFINWLGKQLILNDRITFNSIENQRKQLHGIGCIWCTSSSIGGAIDLKWYYLNEFNGEWKETMVSITWRNRMQLMYFINWRSNWSGMKFSYSIQLGMTKGNTGINYMEE
jgi:hypothetical protein